MMVVLFPIGKMENDILTLLWKKKKHSQSQTQFTNSLRTEMTIKTTELLKLFSKAKQLGFSVEVREDKDGDYVIRIYEMFRPENFDENVVITQKGESDWNKDGYSFDYMMDVLDGMLEEKRQEKIKEQKRQEVLARLTDFEKDLLGVK